MSFNSNPPLQINQLPQSIDFPKDQEQFLETLSLAYKRIVNAINRKEGSYYLLEEMGTFIKYFQPPPYTDQKTTFSTRDIYRTTFDLVALNGAPIPPGTTPISLSTTTTPPAIVGALYPTRGYGAATYTVAGVNTFVFTDGSFSVTFTNTSNTSQTITVTNNTGQSLIQCYWVMEYSKT